MKGVLPWSARCARADIRDVCPALVAVHYFSSFVLIAQQAVQAVVLGHLSLNVCLWVQPIVFLLLLLFLTAWFHDFWERKTKFLKIFPMIFKIWIVDVVDSSCSFS
jgi:hypothetical protein